MELFVGPLKTLKFIVYFSSFYHLFFKQNKWQFPDFFQLRMILQTCNNSSKGNFKQVIIQYLLGYAIIAMQNKRKISAFCFVLSLKKRFRKKCMHFKSRQCVEFTICYQLKNLIPKLLARPLYMCKHKRFYHFTFNLQQLCWKTVCK